MKNPHIIKKTWLALLLATTLIGLIFSGTLFFSLGISSGSAQFFLNKKMMISGITGLVTAVLIPYALYRCAYQKPGTALLTFYLILALLPIPFSLFKLKETLYSFRDSMELIAPYLNVSNPHLFASFFVYLHVFSTILGYVFLYYSYQLRKLNQKTQTENILSISEYRSLIEEMQAALNSNDLKEAYASGVRKHPQNAWYYKKQFKQLLKQFG